MNRPGSANPQQPSPPRITAATARPFPVASIALATLVVLVGLLYWFDPVKHAFYPVCFFHQLTGLNCPGCGGLRAVHHLTHGELRAAFHSNPLLVVALPFIGWLGYRWLRRANAMSSLTVTRIAWLVLAVVLVFGVLRNLPGPAFAWMSP